MNNTQILNRASNRKSSQAGFSLIELIITVVILSIVLIAISRAIMTTVKSDSRLVEQSEAATRSNIITDILQNDFSNPLRFFYGSQISMVGTFPVIFQPHSDYQLLPGSARRLIQSSAAPIVSSVIMQSGEGTARFNLPATSSATFGWRTSVSAVGAPANFATIHLSVKTVSQRPTRSFTVITSGGVESSGVVADADKFEVRIENLPAPYGCRVGFYAVSTFQITLMARSAGVCPAMPLEIIANISNVNNSLASEMFGSFVMRPNSDQLAPLPFVGATQISTPVFVNPENGDLVLFRADSGTDKTHSLDPVTFQSGQTSTFRVKIPARGTYKPGDYVFIVDYAANRSVVALVSSAAATLDALQLSVSPVGSQSSAAWGLFYSRPEDFTGIQFQKGTEIIHLAAPIMYRFLPADKLIIRRVGSGLWETVAPGVSAFNSSVSAKALNIEVLAATEGIETYNNQPTQRTAMTIPIE